MLRRAVVLIIFLAIAISCIYVSAQEAREEKEYYVNGNLKLITQYNKRNEKHGIEKFYYETGQLWSKTIFIRDRKDGSEKVYYKSGVLMREKTYKKGVLEGLERAYWENGNLMEELPYIEGMKHGTARFYDIDGELVEEQTWEDNDLVSTRNVD